MWKLILVGLALKQLIPNMHGEAELQVQGSGFSGLRVLQLHSSYKL